MISWQLLNHGEKEEGLPSLLFWTKWGNFEGKWNHSKFVSKQNVCPTGTQAVWNHFGRGKCSTVNCSSEERSSPGHQGRLPGAGPQQVLQNDLGEQILETRRQGPKSQEEVDDPATLEGKEEGEVDSSWFVIVNDLVHLFCDRITCSNLSNLVSYPSSYIIRLEF